MQDSKFEEPARLVNLSGKDLPGRAVLEIPWPENCDLLNDIPGLAWALITAHSLGEWRSQKATRVALPENPELVVGVVAVFSAARRAQELLPDLENKPVYFFYNAGIDWSTNDKGLDLDSLRIASDGVFPEISGEFFEAMGISDSATRSALLGGLSQAPELAESLKRVLRL